VPAEEAVMLIETPPSEDMGDYALPCFTLAKKFRKSPKDIAIELAGAFCPNLMP